MQLDQFLRKSTPRERSELAEQCGSSVNYLYQIAGGHRFASSRLALKIEAETSKIASRSPFRLQLVNRHTLIRHPEIFDLPNAEAGPGE